MKDYIKPAMQKIKCGTGFQPVFLTSRRDACTTLGRIAAFFFASWLALTSRAGDFDRPSLGDFDVMVDRSTAIRNTINDRKSALFQTNSWLTIFCGTRIESFRYEQDCVEALVSSFVDPLIPIVDHIPYYTYVYPSTLDAWRTASGINVAGFIRYLPDGGTAYGLAMPDDKPIRALFDEMRAGLTNLKWTAIISGDVTNGTISVGRGNTIAEANGDFGHTEPAPYPYVVWADKNVGTATPYLDIQARVRSSAVLRDYYTGAPSDKTVYGWPMSDVHAFQDIDNVGIIQGQFWLIENISASQSAPLVSKMISEEGAAPFLLADDPPITDDSPDGGFFCGFSSYAWIMKWDFKLWSW